MNMLPLSELVNYLPNVFLNAIHGFFLIEGNNIDDKNIFLAEFAEKLNFPKYFGFNWDAFYDCMTDLSWLDSENGFLIIYRNSHNFRSNELSEWKIANEILLEVMDYWKEYGKLMIIVLS